MANSDTESNEAFTVELQNKDDRMVSQYDIYLIKFDIYC